MQTLTPSHNNNHNGIGFKEDIGGKFYKYILLPVSPDSKLRNMILDLNNSDISESKNTQKESLYEFGRSEAERKLNFNFLPNKATQKKVDKLISPYNTKKIIQKFMTFTEDKKHIPISIQESSQEKWNKISSLIFSKDKVNFRDTMFSINKDLYKQLGKNMKYNVQNYMDFEDLRKIEQ